MYWAINVPGEWAWAQRALRATKYGEHRQPSHAGDLSGWQYSWNVLVNKEELNSLKKELARVLKTLLICYK